MDSYDYNFYNFQMFLGEKPPTLEQIDYADAETETQHEYRAWVAEVNADLVANVEHAWSIEPEAQYEEEKDISEDMDEDRMVRSRFASHGRSTRAASTDFYQLLGLFLPFVTTR